MLLPGQQLTMFNDLTDGACGSHALAGTFSLADLARNLGVTVDLLYTATRLGFWTKNEMTSFVKGIERGV